tara:strand:+ start:26 stop:217 length:192 start_codon:yes stop_codon:yes gene_type:complete
LRLNSTFFCSYHKIKQELTICGWIDKKDFTKKEDFIQKEVPKKDLTKALLQPLPICMKLITSK